MDTLLTMASILTSSNHTPVAANVTLDQWWGPKQLGGNEDTSIRPAAIYFDDLMTEDLKYRLRRHVPFRPPLEGSGFNYGFNSNAILGWLYYWSELYPFKQREAFLNQYPQFRTNIQGLDIHFVWVKPRVPPKKEVVPLLLLHGWPGSIREFYESIPILTANYKDKDFAVEVIAPCLPGFGFSDAAVRPGLSSDQMAIILRNLMHRLGFQRFYIQGGDWGGFIGSLIATLFPQEVLGYHTNWPMVLSPQAMKLFLEQAANHTLIIDPKLADRVYPLDEKLGFLLQETGYLHEAATKPDTVGIALTDSPAGLLAFIMEKFSTGAKVENLKLEDGGLGDTFTPEQLVDNVMIYWATRSMTTSLRLYAESFNIKHFSLGLEGRPTLAPTWAIQPKNELAYQPPSILKLKYKNLLNVTALDYGGHFFALQYPKKFSDHVLYALEGFRLWHRNQKV